MKKITIYLFTCFAFFLIWSCNNDQDIEDKTIFPDSEIENSEFDRWIKEYLSYPYNIKLLYKFSDIEADDSYTLAPATIEKSQKMAKLIRFLWLDIYDEVGGVDFTRLAAPKVMQFIGSGAYDAKGTAILGTAEGGMKITLYSVNDLNTASGTVANASYFKTIHHEFAHVINQLKDYDPEFEKVCYGDYVGGDWYLKPDSETLPLGFISKYARSSPGEDFAEMISIYITGGRANWKIKLNAAGVDGKVKLETKFDMVKKYLKESWNIDFEQLHDVVQRRGQEVQFLDFDNLYPLK